MRPLESERAWLDLPGPLAAPEPLTVKAAVELPQGLHAVGLQLPQPLPSGASLELPRSRQQTMPRSLGEPQPDTTPLISDPVVDPWQPANPASPASSPPPSTDPGPTRSGRMSWRWLQLVLLLLLIPLASSGSHRTSQQPHTAPPVPTASRGARAAVGMPVPGGEVPVDAVRVTVVSQTAPLPASERRTLANWIANTQHPGTRVRLVRGELATRALSAGQLSQAPRYRGSAAAARHWLHASHAIRGRLVRLVSSDTSSGRETIAVTETMLHTRNAEAAAIARRIMSVARQREIGVAVP